MSRNNKKNAPLSLNNNLDNFKAKTENQKNFIRSICENVITIGYGCAGTGKSICSAHIACQKLKKHDTNNVFIVKPIICCENHIGILPGDLENKIQPYMYPVLDYFEHFLGKANCLNYIGRSIHFFPVELIRGHTYNDSIIILEEAQNCTPKQMKLFLSRIGQNSKMIVIGDNRQSDINNNGLQFCIDNLKNIKKINIVEFTKYDVIRNSIIPEIIEIFDEKGI